eukprot:COSAG01_NODE_2600_length_7396_cov_35.648212_10_plen_445_part_00
MDLSTRWVLSEGSAYDKVTRSDKTDSILYVVSWQVNFHGKITPGEYMGYMDSYQQNQVSVFDPDDSEPESGLLELWVDNGYLVQGSNRTFIGTRASMLQELIDALPPPVPLTNVTAVVNATQLRRLRLTGSYEADIPLRLPSLFVLALGEGTTYTASAAGIGNRSVSCQIAGKHPDGTWCDHPRMISANGTYYTAIVGGNFDCGALPPAFFGTTGIFGGHVRAFTLLNVKVRNCGEGRNYSTGNVMVQDGDHGEISHSEFSGGSRGIWLERNVALAVHHVHVHDCGPLIDVDNGNNGVLLYSNVMENTDAYGMWIELSSTGCWVFNNTIRNASFAIVAVSAAGHRFIGNRLLDPNCANGHCGTIVFGVASKGPGRLGDIFASNTISGTNVSRYPPGSQGGLVNNWFFDNDFVGATNGEVFGRYLGYSTSEISIFDIAPPTKRPI